VSPAPGLPPSGRLPRGPAARDRFRAAGTPSYWVVDPDEPSLTVWERAPGGTYVEVAPVTDGETARLSSPYGVRVTPSALVDDRRT
jgi:Uma2 family endonuclease